MLQWRRLRLGLIPRVPAAGVSTTTVACRAAASSSSRRNKHGHDHQQRSNGNKNTTTRHFPRGDVRRSSPVASPPEASSSNGLGDHHHGQRAERRRRRHMAEVPSTSSSASGLPHRNDAASRTPRTASPTTSSELQNAYQRIYALALRHPHVPPSSEQPPNADGGSGHPVSQQERQATAIRDAHAHLVNAQRWALATDAEDAVRHACVRAELLPAVRDARLVLVRRLSGRFGHTFYRTSSVGPAGDDRVEDGGAATASNTKRWRTAPSSPSSFWATAIALHMSGDASQHKSAALEKIDTAADEAERQAVADDEPRGFAAGDGLAPHDDLEEKMEALRRSPLLRSLVLASSFRSARNVDIDHAMHSAAAALTLTCVPVTSLVLSRHASDVFQDSTNDLTAQVASRLDARAAALRQGLALQSRVFADEDGGNGHRYRHDFVAAADLEEVMVVRQQHSGQDSAATKSSAYAPSLVMGLQEVAGRSRVVGCMHAGVAALRRAGVPIQKIALRSFGAPTFRTLEVDSGGGEQPSPTAAASLLSSSTTTPSDGAEGSPLATNDDHQLVATVTIPEGCFPGPILPSREHALASLLLAAARAAERFAVRCAAGDVDDAAEAACAVQLVDLVDLLAMWVNFSSYPFVHLESYLRLVDAVDGLVHEQQRAAAVQRQEDRSPSRLTTQQATSMVGVGSLESHARILLRFALELDAQDPTFASARTVVERLWQAQLHRHGHLGADVRIGHLLECYTSPAPRKRWVAALAMVVDAGRRGTVDEPRNASRGVERALALVAQQLPRGGGNHVPLGAWNTALRLIGALVVGGGDDERRQPASSLKALSLAALFALRDDRTPWDAALRLVSATLESSAQHYSHAYDGEAMVSSSSRLNHQMQQDLPDGLARVISAAVAKHVPPERLPRAWEMLLEANGTLFAATSGGTRGRAGGGIDVVSGQPVLLRAAHAGQPGDVPAMMRKFLQQSTSASSTTVTSRQHVPFVPMLEVLTRLQYAGRWAEAVGLAEDLRGRSSIATRDFLVAVALVALLEGNPYPLAAALGSLAFVSGEAACADFITEICLRRPPQSQRIVLSAVVEAGASLCGGPMDWVERAADGLGVAASPTKGAAAGGIENGGSHHRDDVCDLAACLHDHIVHSATLQGKKKLKGRKAGVIRHQEGHAGPRTSIETKPLTLGAVTGLVDRLRETGSASDAVLADGIEAADGSVDLLALLPRALSGVFADLPDRLLADRSGGWSPAVATTFRKVVSGVVPSGRILQATAGGKGLPSSSLLS